MKRLNLFITLCLFVILANAQKYSPNTEIFLSKQQTNPALKSKDQTAKNLTAFLTINDDTAIDELEAIGVHVGTRTGQLVTASFPENKIEQIATLEGIEYIQISSPVELKMDKAREICKADAAHNPANALGQAYTGKGVIVGIVDNGFDFRHPAFRTSDGKTLRIKKVWDQNKTVGKRPSKYNYGAEYTTEEEILSASTDFEGSTNLIDHGTHVAGIASGSKCTNKYYGVAPDADLVLVSFQNGNASIVDAVQYIFEYADAVDKPCVINLSLGSHQGPHDGTSPMDVMFDSLQGEGRIIVGAAGNEGETALHLKKIFSEQDTIVKTAIDFYNEQAFKPFSLIDIWGTEGDEFNVQVCTIDRMKGSIINQTKKVSSSDKGTKRFNFTANNSGVNATATISPEIAESNNRPHILIDINCNNSLSSNRKIGLVITSKKGEVNMWEVASNSFTSMNKFKWTNGDTNSTCGEIGGTGKRIITVGAFNTRFSYFTWQGFTASQESSTPLKDISEFSSLGPTMDGRVKPTVTAPGMLIISAVPNYYTDTEYAAERINDGIQKNKFYYYSSNMGTSMATPYVTGSIALWLEANPKLTPETVARILSETAINDTFTGGRLGNKHNNTWGYGKIDTYAGLAEAKHLQESGIDQIAEETVRVSMSYNTQTLSMVFLEESKDWDVEIFRLDGSKIYQDEFQVEGQGDLLEIPTSAWGKGIHIVKANCGAEQKTFKIAF